MVVDSEEVGVAQDDQRGPGGDLGGINRALLPSAAEAQLERGRVVRLDSTVTAALVHEPSDSSLLWDAVRVMARLLKEANELDAGIALAWRDHQRAAKKRARAIQYTRGRPKRVQLYRELINITRATLAYLHHAALRLAGAAGLAVELWQAKVRHYRPLIEQIIAQTERRVLAGEPVPASAKLVSLFEPHADIIRKGGEVAYGHKLNLTTGRRRIRCRWWSPASMTPRCSTPARPSWR